MTAGKVFVGISGRTNEDGVRQLAAALEPRGFEVVSLPVSGCLHLKSAVTAVWAPPVRGRGVLIVESRVGRRQLLPGLRSDPGRSVRTGRGQRSPHRLLPDLRGGAPQDPPPARASGLRYASRPSRRAGESRRRGDMLLGHAQHRFFLTGPFRQHGIERAVVAARAGATRSDSPASCRRSARWLVLARRFAQLTIGDEQRRAGNVRGLCQVIAWSPGVTPRRSVIGTAKKVQASHSHGCRHDKRNGEDARRHD